MRLLTVHYCGWGEDWPLGRLADDGQSLLFEYSPEALAQGLELSPLHLPLGPRAYGNFPAHLHRLPGVIADSLPDGWGLLLMDRLFRPHGVRHPGPLDRLAFIGDRAMGALRFAPASETAISEPDWSLLALAEEARLVLADEASTALRELMLAGGSPQGARPKALVRYHAATDQISTRPDAPGEPWLVKFPAEGEPKEVCVVEQVYAELARDCGLEMPDSRWFDLGPNAAAFGVARFDREGGQRVAVQSLAGLLQVDFRLPGATDYTAFLRATRLLTRDEREVEKAYARAVFNVAFHNRDDHPKNFAWRLGRDRRWVLAPAFDLTFSDGPRGQHHMDVCGEAGAVELHHLLRLAKEAGVSLGRAEEMIDRMRVQANSLGERLERASAGPLQAQRIQAAVEECCRRLG